MISKMMWMVGVAMISPMGQLRAQLIPESGQKPADTSVAAVPPAPSDSVSLKQYKAQRAESEKALETDQKALDDLKQQRAQVESELAIASATAAESRSKNLLMSDDITALKSLDSILTATQQALTEQRDRLLALRDAVGHRASGQLVILVRADSVGGSVHLDSLRVTIDSAPSGSRHYSARANVALAEGAVDEVYRSTVLPATHDVVLFAFAGGAAGPATQSASVTIAGGNTTFVEFKLHGTQWIESSWTSNGTAR